MDKFKEPVTYEEAVERKENLLNKLNKYNEELLEGKREDDKIPMFARTFNELSKEDQEEIVNLIKFKKMYKDNKFIE